jgi:hypothetical protein
MILEERKEYYKELKEIENRIPILEQQEATAIQLGEVVFNKLSAIDTEKAYEEADKAGWISADELHDQIADAKTRREELYSILDKYEFCFDEYESTGAYGITEKKKVKVIFLDGREEFGLIYPWVYDNPSDYYLRTENGTIDLGEGWEIAEIVLIGEK